METSRLLKASITSELKIFVTGDLLLIHGPTMSETKLFLPPRLPLQMFTVKSAMNFPHIWLQAKVFWLLDTVSHLGHSPSFKCTVTDSVNARRAKLMLTFQFKLYWTVDLDSVLSKLIPLMLYLTSTSMEYQSKVAKTTKPKDQLNKIVQAWTIVQLAAELLSIPTVLKSRTSNVGKLMTMEHYQANKVCSNSSNGDLWYVGLIKTQHNSLTTREESSKKSQSVRR